MKEYFEHLYKGNFDALKKDLIKRMKKEVKTFVVTANPETFMVANQEKEFEKLLLDKESIVVPDGIGVVKAARMLKYPIKERIAGIDIAWMLLEEGNRLGKSIFLLGAVEEVIKKMEEKIKQEYPNLKLLGAVNGYVSDKDAVFEKIKQSEPDIVLVALGIPAQEKLIYKHLKDFKKGIFVGVGGSFDIISETKKRAPKAFRKMNLEWLYRITTEPKRLKKFYKNNVKFIFKVKKLKKQEK